MLENWNRRESDEEKLVKIRKAVQKALKSAGMAGSDAFIVMPLEKSVLGASFNIVGFSGTSNAFNAWHIDVPLVSVREKLQRINTSHIPVFKFWVDKEKKRYLRLVNDKLYPRLIKHADGSEHIIKEEC